jgi:hypothetical protein
VLAKARGEANAKAAKAAGQPIRNPGQYARRLARLAAKAAEEGKK